MSPKTYSTGEAAAAVGVSRQTLQAWISAGKFKAPRAQDIGNVRVRVWTDSDVARLRQAKRKIFGTGRTGRPPGKRVPGPHMKR